MQRHVKWLRSEIDQWVRDGLIEPDQGRAIRSRYSGTGAVAWGKVIFSGIGAVMIGLGMILFFAYNWEDMHKFVKLGIIFSALIAAHAAGFRFRREAGNHRAAGEGFHLLGTMLFGAGIWLVAQIYHIDEHFPNAFLVWGLGALALAWAMPSVPQGIAAAVLLVIWNGAESLAFDNANPAGPLLVFAGILPLAGILRSRILAAVGMVSFLVSLCFSAVRIDELMVVLLFLWCGGLVALSIFLRENDLLPEVAPVAAWIGGLPYLSILYAMSFEDVGGDPIHLDFGEPLVWIGFSLSALFAFGLWGMVMLWRTGAGKRPVPPEDRLPEVLRLNSFGVPVALVFFTLQAMPDMGLTGWAGAGLYNLIFLFHAILLIVYGCQTGEARWTFAGCFLVALLTASRYVDLFESLLIRSLVFVVVGALIFITGNIYTRTRKEKQEGPA